MKYIAFLILFAPPALVLGLVVGLFSRNAWLGLIAAGYMLAFSADVCFNGSDEQ